MIAADFLPPLLARGLRTARRKIQGPKLHMNAFGRRIEHRDSEADRGVIDQVFYGRDYDFSTLRRYPEIQRFYEACERPLIVDAGANIGASAVWFAETFPNASVTAVEPHGGNFDLLKRNVTGLNVRPVLGAVALTSGRLRLFDPGEGEWGFRTSESGGADLGDVQAYRVDELIRPGETPFVLKMDIEGGETGLFDLEDKAFERFPVIVIELHDWMLPRSGSSASFLRWHLSQDRDFVQRGENVFSICNRLLTQ
jgi:FkbM family methyltransferase